MFKSHYSVQNLTEIFLKSVDAILPRNLIRNEVNFNQSHLTVRGHSFPIRKSCYLIGFGKAVLEMAVEMERILNSHVEMAVVTVPVGIFEKHLKPENSRIKFIEGAKNNLPDKDAMGGAWVIKELVETLREDDLLIVLISGEKKDVHISDFLSVIF